MNQTDDSTRRDSETPHERPQFVVRCGAMRALGVMSAEQLFHYGDQVVARTARGTEVGTVLCEANSETIDYIAQSCEGVILRKMTAEDRGQIERFEAKVRDDIQDCQRLADSLSLQMQVVDVERILGGERMVVYYLAENRVDFRQLVRDLAGFFQTRIEMRQIGVRDEAKLLADYGDCGQPICCGAYLSKMPPVSMRMAKLQKATLDPTKISGRCGRLKCCLRYEFDIYESMASELPPIGSEILTRDGSASVLGHDILSQQVSVKTEDGRRIMVAACDIISVTRQAVAESGRRSRH